MPENCIYAGIVIGNLNKMNIREASFEDVDQIQYLSQQLGYNYPIEKMILKINKILENPEHKIFVATINEVVIGYIHVEVYSVLYSDDLLNILGIVVDSSNRNKGVGKALLKEVEIIATELNCIGIRANSGSSREDAHFFYRRSGFDSEKNQVRFIKQLEI